MIEKEKKYSSSKAQSKTFRLLKVKKYLLERTEKEYIDECSKDVQALINSQSNITELNIGNSLKLYRGKKYM